MMQGRASSSKMGSTKVEPRSHAVSPAAVADMGISKGNHAETGDMPFTSRPVYIGRGLSAPMAACTIHHCGSQGKHK